MPASFPGGWREEGRLYRAYCAPAAKIIQEFKSRTRDTRNAKGPPEDLGKFIGAQQTGREYKRPGDTKWVSVRDKAAVEQICRVKNANGEPAEQIDP
ncbi:MAG: hypothetical protein QM753_07560 [Thermomicrobiales bacterium]